MVLINVDLPQPLGPMMAICSPALMLSVKSSSTILSPRITEIWRKSSSAGDWRGPSAASASEGDSWNIIREYTMRVSDKSNSFAGGGLCHRLAVDRRDGAAQGRSTQVAPCF